jgi:hypothetical protein
MNQASGSLGHKAADNSQEVYAVNHQGLRLVVPAIVFCKALFAPNATTFEYLYRPSGIDLLPAPVRRPTGMAVILIPRIIRQHDPISKSNMARLQWLYCFPSARAAFDSVYFNAARGAIGLELPKNLRRHLISGTTPRRHARGIRAHHQPIQNARNPIFLGWRAARRIRNHRRKRVVTPQSHPQKQSPYRRCRRLGPF